MKILWLSNYRRAWNFNHWFHYDFAEIIAEQPGIELKSYGRNMSIGYPKYDLQPLRPNTTIEQLRKKFNFDVIIMDGKARMILNQKTEKTWLPINFDKINVPKILIEGDYHNYKLKQWYINRGVNIILHRHKNNTKLGKIDLPQIKHIWFPCSVDTKLFKPNSEIEREKILCFIGGKNICYIYRNKVIKTLKGNNLIKVYPKRIGGQKYIEILQSFISHVSGSSKFNIDTAKMFEIMACGSVLFTDESDEHGLKDLFDKGSYVTYKRDFSDLLVKANKIINDSDYRAKITKKAVKCINERHTHTIRAQQLLTIIKENYGIC